MNPSPLTYPQSMKCKPFRAEQLSQSLSQSTLTPLFWSVALGLLLPCYGSLPLGLPTRPVAQPIEQRLKVGTLPLRCHAQAIAEMAAKPG